MKYVIERDREYYAGFVDGRPSWLTQRRPETQFDSETAEKIVQQLRACGYTGMEVKLYQARVRTRGGRKQAAS
jgi:hypothetical protein